MRLGDLDELFEEMKHRKDYVGRLSDPMCLVQDAPTIDAVLVVRCEDCIYSSSAHGEIFECRKHSKVRESKFGISTMFLERHERGFFCADGRKAGWN